jgi:hypothetical protein
MKKMFFLMLTFVLGIAASMNAQVNIGSPDAPHKGAVLDLSKSSSESGVLLPRVYIFNTKQFQLAADEVTDPTGMLVYNTNSGLPDGVGLYAWNGSEWRSMIGDSRCVPVKVTSASSKTGTNAKITITVSEGTPNFSYTWYKGETPVKTTANVSTASDNYTATEAGSYTCRISNPCTVTPVSLTFAVDADGETLIDNGNGTFTDKDGNLVYNGKIYRPLKSDIPGIYIDEADDIVYAGADGIPDNEDDNTFVIPEYPIPRQNIRATFASPVNPFPSGGATAPVVLDFATPYNGKVKYVSSDPNLLSVSEDGILTSTSSDTDARVPILVLFEDGSIATRNYELSTAVQRNSTNTKLASVQNTTTTTFVNELKSISTGLVAVNSANSAYNVKSISYEIEEDPDETGSILSPYGRFMQAGPKPGTVNVKAIMTDTDNQEFTGTITVIVLGEPPVETTYETTSTNWGTLDPAPDYAGGSGTAADPYLISSVRQLKKLSMDLTVSGNVDASYGKFFTLTTDLDFEEDKTVTNALIGNFYGTFDGQGHLIKKLTIHATASGAGIFASIRFGELKNLGRAGGATNSTATNAGGLCGTIYNAKLMNCFNTAAVTAATYAGGLVALTATDSPGIAETLPSVIENCYNTGPVTTTTANSGGLVGGGSTNGGLLILKNSYNTGKIESLTFAGGLMGRVAGGNGVVQVFDFSNSFNFGDVVISTNVNRVGSILGGVISGSDNPNLLPLTIMANNVISRPDVAKKNTSVAVNHVIGYGNETQSTWGQGVLSANPTLKEDAKYTDEYVKSASFVVELGGAFKYANGHTPKLAWEK